MTEDDDEPSADAAEGDVVHLPIEDSIDLHTFAPRDVASVVESYLDEARAHGFTEVRIIHGKGTGTLRRIVHSVLEKHPAVADFRLGGEGTGQWGATIVRLR